MGVAASIVSASISQSASDARAQQGGMILGSPISRGHVPYAVQAGGPGAGVFNDGGPAQSGNISEIGITNTGTPFCITDQPVTNPGYHQLCLGADSNGHALISSTAYGSIAPIPLEFCANGVCETFPFTTPGTGIVGPNPSVIGSVPVWSNAVGTMLSDPSIPNVDLGMQIINGQALIGNKTDWLEPLVADTGALGMVRSLVTGPNAFGYVAGLRTSDTPLSGFPAFRFGYGSYVFNDATTTHGAFPYLGWNYFGSCYRAAGIPTINNCIGMELDVNELNSFAPGFNNANPYFNGGANALSAGLWVAGGDGSGAAFHPASAAMAILNNGAPFKSGIVFFSTGLDGDNGTTGIGEALALAKGHEFNWYAPDLGIGSFIRSDAADSTNPVGLVFTSGSLALQSKTDLFLGLSAGSLGSGPGTAHLSLSGSQTYLINSSSAGQLAIFDQTTGGFVLSVLGGDLTLGESGHNIVMPAIPSSGTAVASVCMDGAGHLFRKTTSGACL